MTRSGRDETPEWYQRMVIEFENERQAHLNTKVILTDLIAELRAEHWLIPDGDGWCQGCGEYQPCPTLRFAGRAEARLRELE